MSPDKKMTWLECTVELTGSSMTRKTEKLLEEFSREEDDEHSTGPRGFDRLRIMAMKDMEKYESKQNELETIIEHECFITVDVPRQWNWGKRLLDVKK